MIKFKLIFAALLLFAIVPALAAAESFVIDKVTVNGIEVDGDKAQVEIGQDVDIVVEVKSGQNLTYPRDAKVRAEIDGYEHESIYDTSDTFTVSPSAIRYRKALKLTLPADMEEGIYTLYVSVYDSVEKVEKRFTLYIEPTRHLLDIKGVAVSPTPFIEAGQTATVKVRLQNVGAKDEDNVKVVAAIEKLKIYDVEWIELVESELYGDDEEDSQTATLYLPIPKDALSGEYELEVGIAYNDEHDTQVVKTTLNVKGVEVKEEAKANSETHAPVVEEPKTPVDPSKELTISFDTTSQHTAVGKEVAYKMTISNLASAARDITLASAGAQLFADVRVDPSVLTIEGGSKADVYVYAKPKSDAELKVSQFTLRVMNEDKLYKELSLSLGVEEAAVEKSNWLPFEDDTLKIVFIGLVVILIIVGLLIAFKRVKGDDYPLEPIEERIYY